MERPTFFKHIRHMFPGGRMTPDQVQGVSNILDEWNVRKLRNPWWLAYMLATVFHETGYKMQPITEFGNQTYLKHKPYYPWIGRGLIQITWEANYKKFGIEKPEDALTWPVALRVMFDGMIKGMFTGKGLNDYFHHLPNDGPPARRIINGMDKAYQIWSYAVQFKAALDAAHFTGEA